MRGTWIFWEGGWWSVVEGGGLEGGGDEDFGWGRCTAIAVRT